jgi:hypothetical protein
VDLDLKSLSQHPDTNGCLNLPFSHNFRTRVAGRYVEGDIDKIKIPQGRDLVLVPCGIPDYLDDLSSFIQRTPFRVGLSPRSHKCFFDSLSHTLPCTTERDKNCRDAWLEDIYAISEWYKEAFSIRSVNIAIMTIKDNPADLDGPLMKNFHVDMPTPKAVSSAVLVRAFPSPGLVYATTKQETPELSKILECHAKVLSKISSKETHDQEGLERERRTLYEQIHPFTEESSAAPAPNDSWILYNASYRYGLVHRSPETSSRRAVVTISGYSYRGDNRSNSRTSNRP